MHISVLRFYFLMSHYSLFLSASYETLHELYIILSQLIYGCIKYLLKFTAFSSLQATQALLLLCSSESLTIFYFTLIIIQKQLLYKDRDMRKCFLLFSWNESLINQTNSALATVHFDPGLEIYNIVWSRSLKLGDKVLLCMIPVGCPSQQDSHTC